jgi:hypothetical protein
MDYQRRPLGFGGISMNDKMRAIEATMQLRNIKVGQSLTQIEMNAIEFLLGGMLEAVRKLEVAKLGAIKFTEKGGAYTTDGNPLGITVNGKQPMNLHGVEDSDEA